MGIPREVRGIAAVGVSLAVILAAMLLAPRPATAQGLEGQWEGDNPPRGLNLVAGDFQISFDVTRGGTRIENMRGGVNGDAPTGPNCESWTLKGDSIPVSADGSFSATVAGSGNDRVEMTGRFVAPNRVEGTFKVFDPDCEPPPEAHPWWAQPVSVAPGEQTPLNFDCKAGGRDGRPYELTAGPIAAIGCWRERGAVAVAHQPVRINGIDLEPRSGSTAVRIDKRDYEISWSGSVLAKVSYVPLATLGEGEWTARRPVVFALEGRDQSVLGLPIGGSVELRFDDGRTSLKLSGELPSLRVLRLARLAGVWGELRVSATNADGLVLDGATLGLPSFWIGQIGVQGATFSITATPGGAYHFDGGVTVYPFPSPTAPGFVGQLGFGIGDDYLRLGLGVENLNVNLDGYGIVWLQRLFAALQVDPFGLGGEIGVTVGPQVRILGGLYSAVRLDGGFEYLGDTLTIDGSAQIGGVLDIAEGQLVYEPGEVSLEGNAALKVWNYGIEGNVDGWFTASAFNLEGDVNVSIPGPDGNGEAVISDTGIGACHHISFAPDVGIGYRWGDTLPSISAWGCELGDWRSAEASGAQALPPSILVRKGTGRLALRVSGAGGPPAVAFVAPDGTRYQPSSAPEGVVASEDVLLVQDAAGAATYLAIDDPTAGRWRIEALPGSPPVTGVSRGEALPRLGLRARVRGRGARRVLRYRVRGRAGRRITFVERGGGTTNVIGRARRARGKIRFRPANGPGGRRRIVAIQSLNGVPGPARVVARYRTRAVRPQRPRRVRVKRLSGYRRLITWRGPRSLTYRVVVRTSDGRRLRYVYRKRKPRKRVTVRAVPRNTRIRVRVIPISAEGIKGPAGRARG